DGDGIGDNADTDDDGDGVQDASEAPLPGVTVDLLGPTGNLIATMPTDANGRYTFDNLPAGTYQVRFTLTPAQAAMYDFTTRDQGGNDANDSDADTMTGLTRTFVLDDTNTALTKTYDRTVNATQGIDPTWDAGVVLRESAPPDTTTPAPTTTVPGGALPVLGSSVGTMLMVAFMLVFGGLVAIATRRRSARPNA
ncbi:MAG TPA: SdrD B-like domain-containing protein, partial [Ilumatobacteraceae bacterium]|nr:SdrD B-like domain-containing protein [Ilumatobacteraceae bacterium]